MSDDNKHNSNEIEKIVLELGVISDLDKIQIKIIGIRLIIPTLETIKFEKSDDLDIYDI
jgi:hypothetical protein